MSPLRSVWCPEMRVVADGPVAVDDRPVTRGDLRRFRVATGQSEQVEPAADDRAVADVGRAEATAYAAWACKRVATRDDLRAAVVDESGLRCALDLDAAAVAWARIRAGDDDPALLDVAGARPPDLFSGRISRESADRTAVLASLATPGGARAYVEQRLRAGPPEWFVSLSVPTPFGRRTDLPPHHAGWGIGPDPSWLNADEFRGHVLLLDERGTLHLVWGYDYGGQIYGPADPRRPGGVGALSSRFFDLRALVAARASLVDVLRAECTPSTQVRWTAS